ncbi:MAG TPA: tRNA pseudouridine(55) synthase TruB, partial [Pyrinomonadaceae bacterium]|nr:tRNA pseudouridine(55) synthase TruB [Pyrinomonadaceae bacterium]
FATGVLVILVGKATRLAQFLDKDVKEYEAVVRFGFETDTGDRTGNRKEEEKGGRGEGEKVSIGKVERILSEFRGEIEQTPPMYSAKKVAGKKLYELARKGLEIERKPLKVTIYEIEVQKSKVEDQSFDVPIRVLCSAGTYIRVLAEDIGGKIGIGAHLAELRRTRAGKFDLSQAATLEELEKIVSENNLDEILISMNEAVSHLPEVVLSEAEIIKTQSGLKLKFEGDKIEDNQPMRLIDQKENLIAVGFYNKEQKFIQPRIVVL